MRTRDFFAPLAALVVGAAPVAAQSGTSWWASGGAGFGSNGVSCGLCTNARNNAWQGMAQGGVALSRGFLLGAEVNGLFDGEENLRRRAFFVGAVGKWYPNPETPLHLKGGLGMYRYRESNPNNANDSPTRSDPLGVQLGVGYDLPVLRSTSISPYANLIVTANDDIIDGNNVLVGARFTQLQLGLSVNWRQRKDAGTRSASAAPAPKKAPAPDPRGNKLPDYRPRN